MSVECQRKGHWTVIMVAVDCCEQRLCTVIAVKLCARVSRIVLRVMCTLLGFVVIPDNSKRWDFRARILVANYTSPMDRLAVELVFPCIMVILAIICLPCFSAYLNLLF